MSTAVALNSRTSKTAMPIAPSSGRTRRESARVRLDRADRAPLVDRDERAGGRRLHEPDAEHRQRRADHDHEEDERTRALAARVDTREAESADDECLNQ